MKRLTEKDKQGNWGLRGVAWRELQEELPRELLEKLYGALWKLMEYEETGMDPDEVEKLKEFEGSNTQKYLIELGKNRWIPVEERLPEELTPVLVTAYVPESKPGWDKRKTFYVVVDTDVYDPETSTGWDCFRDKVIAWRPFPEPYRSKRRDNHDGE